MIKSYYPQKIPEDFFETFRYHVSRYGYIIGKEKMIQNLKDNDCPFSHGHIVTMLLCEHKYDLVTKYLENSSIFTDLRIDALDRKEPVLYNMVKRRMIKIINEMEW